MTTKTISTYIAAGYTLSSAYSRLVITTSGGIGGTGLFAGSYAKIFNDGVIHGSGASDGVVLNAGGLVQNGDTTVTSALIEGYTGVIVNGAAGSVANFGTIKAADLKGDPGAVYLSDGGSVTNGSSGDTTAQIRGYRGVEVNGAPGTVANFGTIVGYTRSGVRLTADGVVTNGSTTDTSALIQGLGRGNGISIGGSGTVSNFGTITAHSKLITAVTLDQGVVTNGSAADTTAKIRGGNGIIVNVGLGTVTNFGTIQLTTVAGLGFGVDLVVGGSVSNGSATDRTALISGHTGIFGGGSSTVVNYGTILATGGGTDFPSYGLAVGPGVATVTNFGAISGYDGIFLSGSDNVVNYGTIMAMGGAYSFGLGTNIFGSGVATVTNFGMIEGTAGKAIQFTSAGDVLIVEANSAFLGAVDGGGGTLKLANGTGILTGLLVGGNVTVSGSMAATAFSNFNTVVIGAAATFATSGAVTIAASQAVIDDGTLSLGASKTTVTNAGLIEADAGSLTIKGALKNTGTLAVAGGTLTVNGAVTGGGSATINGGTLDLASSFTENVSFLGKTGILELAQSQGYSGKVSGFSKTGGTSLDLVDIAFVGAAEATYSGTKTSGVLTVTDGTHTAHINLIGDYRTSTFVAASDGHGGTIVHDPPAPVAWIAASSGQRFIAAMAGFGDTSAGYLGPGRSEPWRGAQASLAAPRTHFA